GATALAVVAVTVAAGAVISTLFLMRAVRAERSSREQLHDSLFNQSRILNSNTELDRRSRALTILQKVAAIHPGLEARNSAIAALTAPGFRVLREWSPGENTFIAWPDRTLKRYALSLPDGSISVRAMEDDKELLRLPPVNPPAVAAEFSPDGSLLAAHGQDWKVHLWDLSTGTLRFSLGQASTYTFTPDGSKLVAHNSKRIEIFDVRTGRGTVVSQKGPFNGYL